MLSRKAKPSPVILSLKLSLIIILLLLTSSSSSSSYHYYHPIKHRVGEQSPVKSWPETSDSHPLSKNTCRVKHYSATAPHVNAFENWSQFPLYHWHNSGSCILQTLNLSCQVLILLCAILSYFSFYYFYWKRNMWINYYYLYLFKFHVIIFCVC